MCYMYHVTQHNTYYIVVIKHTMFKKDSVTTSHQLDIGMQKVWKGQLTNMILATRGPKIA